MSRQKKTTKENEIETATDVAITESLTRIEDRIYVIRGKQVMLDRDLAQLYGVETKILNKAVKRNIERFPSDFMFQITEEELSNLRFHFGTSSYGSLSSDYAQESDLVFQNGISNWGGTRYLPYAFTENGVAMLSGILRSDTAVKVNIAIMRAFTAMRHFMMSNAPMFQRLEAIEHHQLLISDNFKTLGDKVGTLETQMTEVFQHFKDKDDKPLEGVFCDGRIFDAHTFICDLIRSAKKDIILIDNYIDDTVLKRLDERAAGITCTIYTKQISDKLQLHIDKHNAQYAPISVIAVGHICHDRFLIIDNTELWHFGASFKDLGRSLFAFSKLHLDIEDVMKHVR